MALVNAGEVRLNYVEHGTGPRAVVFIHGNLGCADWMDLIWPLLSEALHVYAIEWRGCGDSDKPEPLPDFDNYSMVQHARDMLAALDSLHIERCGLATHSTGAIISTHMLLMAPNRFDKVLALDPVSARGLAMGDGAAALMKAMKADRSLSFAGLASAVPTLFQPETLAPNTVPIFRPQTTKPQRRLFNRLVDKTRVLSDGIWFGTPFHLSRAYRSGELVPQEASIAHEHLVLWGQQDIYIPRRDVEAMAREMPNCRLEVLEGVGHSCNLEAPHTYADRFNQFFTAQ